MTNQFYFICYLLSSDSNFGHSFAPNYPPYVADGPLPYSFTLCSRDAQIYKHPKNKRHKKKPRMHKACLCDGYACLTNHCWTVRRSAQREHAVYSGGRPSQRYTLSQPEFSLTSFLFTTLPILFIIGEYTILIPRYSFI